MATTIRDVAEAAGVSAMAVSKVLHGTGATVRVSDETAKNIRRVAAELRYQPNRLARNFRQQKTNTIGLVFTHFARIGEYDGYFAALLNGVLTATFESDFGLTICPELTESSSHGLINDGRFDGLLWCKPGYSEEGRESIQRSSMPIVMMHAPDGYGPSVPRFCCDNSLGLQLAIDHIVGLGHRKVAFVIDPYNHTTAEGRTRAAAFHAAMARHELFTSDSDVLFWSFSCNELSEFMTKPDRHTALVVFSERHAVSLLRTADGLGIAIPDALSVVGFDSSAICEATRPRLTAISQPIEQMAYDATKALISYIEADSFPSRSFIYPCGLDVRDSTACPPSRS